MSRFSIAWSGLKAETRGFSRLQTPEVAIEVSESDLVQEAETFLGFLFDYLTRSGRQIKAGETMNYGYWLVKFNQRSQERLEVWEYNTEGSDFVRGASLTLKYWRDQHLVCGQHGAEFSPPRADKLTAISGGVLEGLPVSAVRYPWQEHMSGWLIVTSQWDQDIKSLRTEHTYHVTAARPDLARFLALPIGYRFDLKDGERVWIDNEVASQAPIT